MLSIVVAAVAAIIILVTAPINYAYAQSTEEIRDILSDYGMEITSCVPIDESLLGAGDLADCKSYGPGNIIEQLRNAREYTERAEKLVEELGLCTGVEDCPEDKNMYLLMKKWGYFGKYVPEIVNGRAVGLTSSSDKLEFLDDYNSGQLVNKTKPAPVITEEAKEARALFDKYWN